MASLKYHILKEYANGVMDEKNRFYPYKVANTTIAARAGKRYYLKSCNVTGTNTGDHAVAAVTIAITVNNVTLYPGYISVPVSAAASNVSTWQGIFQECKLLADLNTPITISTSNPTNAYATIIYAEVDEVAGEYSG